MWKMFIAINKIFTTDIIKRKEEYQVCHISDGAGDSLA